MEDRESEDSLAFWFDRRSDQKTPDQGRPVTYSQPFITRFSFFFFVVFSSLHLRRASNIRGIAWILRLHKEVEVVLGFTLTMPLLLYPQLLRRTPSAKNVLNLRAQV